MTDTTVETATRIPLAPLASPVKRVARYACDIDVRRTGTREFRAFRGTREIQNRGIGGFLNTLFVINEERARSPGLRFSVLLTPFIPRGKLPVEILDFGDSLD